MIAYTPIAKLKSKEIVREISKNMRIPVLGYKKAIKPRKTTKKA
jgi:hypothetical protein